MKLDNTVVFNHKPSGGRPSIYPFARMEVGDSFVVKGKAKGRRLQAASSAYARRHGVKLATMTTEEGVRCWRIE